MGQIRAEQCARACMARNPIVHRRYRCHRGSKGLEWWLIPMKAMEFLPAAKARGMSLSDFSGARHAAKSAIPSSLPLHVQETKSSATAWEHSQLIIPLPTQVPVESWAQGWELHPKRGECRMAHIQTSQLKARLQAWVTESSCREEHKLICRMLLA